MSQISLDKGMIFTCSVDSNYMDYLYCLANSISINSPKIPLHIRIVGTYTEKKEQEYFENLKKCNNNFFIDFDRKLLSKDKKYMRSKDQLLYGKSLNENIKAKQESKNFKNVKNNFFLMSERQCYTSNTRFRNTLNLLNHGYSYVMNIDADTIIRKNILDIKDELYQYDVCCNISDCDRYKTSTCWELSFLGTKHSSSVIKFITRCKNLTEANMFDWDSDQNSIEEAYHFYKEKLNINSKIDHIEDIGNLHNREYNNESYIWAGSGTNKTKQNKFTLELEKYYKI